MAGTDVVELRCHHLDGSVGKNPSGVKVWGVIHWVPADQSIPAEVRLYDRLYLEAQPEEGLGDVLNPHSVEVVGGARLEPSLSAADPGSRWQLERLGYFAFDNVKSEPDAPVMNRVVTLRDSWHSRAQSSSPPTPAAPERAVRKTGSRPPRKSRIEYRAEARARDPLLADRFTAWPVTYGLTEDEVDLLTADRPTGDLFEETVRAGAPPDVTARWVINDLPRDLADRPSDRTPLTGRGLAALLQMVTSGAITGVAAKEVFAEMVRNGGDPQVIIADRGLAQVSDEGTITSIIDKVLAANPDKVEQYRSGKTGLLGFFMGQVVRSSAGKANPQVIRQLLGDRLGQDG
jgi:glutaminyl-tRNA synthetase